ncbi:hypothetical protein AB6A40_010830 [Gnathostoma spinigerum]|uniref:Uncharacterized protein n=1 Tax=Gnathostoma spinigerum TaxID=75299 RepID=A0ABD6EXR4_9BILA
MCVVLEAKNPKKIEGGTSAPCANEEILEEGKTQSLAPEELAMQANERSSSPKAIYAPVVSAENLSDGPFESVRHLLQRQMREKTFRPGVPTIGLQPTQQPAETINLVGNAINVNVPNPDEMAENNGFIPMSQTPNAFGGKDDMSIAYIYT